MNNEVWADVDWFPNYKVSNRGRVWNIKRDYFLRPALVNGYHKVALSSNGGTRSFFLHRLVGEAFLGPGRHLFINHIDGNKTNNDVENLEWVTHEQNMRHAHESSFVTSPGIPAIGVRIVELDKEFRSLSECARYLSGSPGPIAHCLNGSRETYRGYSFERVV